MRILAQGLPELAGRITGVLVVVAVPVVLTVLAFLGARRTRGLVRAALYVVAYFMLVVSVFAAASAFFTAIGGS